MTRYEQLLENYEDAYFALLMEDVAQAEGARLEKLNIELQNDPESNVTEELNRRCLKTINRYFAKTRRLHYYRVIRKALNVAAVLIALMMLSFTTAFAFSDDVRAATLNLVIIVNEKYTQLDMQDSVSAAGSISGRVEDISQCFKDLCIEWIPEGYQYASGEYNYQALFCNDEGEWIVIEKYNGTAVLNVDTENAEIVEPVEINGSSGLCIVKNGQTHIALANTEHSVFIDILASKSVSREVVERFAENIFIK